MRTAGDTIAIDGVIDTFDFQLVFQRNIRFFKGRFLQQVFVNLNGIESSISQKRFGVDKRMCLEEVL